MLLVCNFSLGNAILKITTSLCSVISTLHDADAKSSLLYNLSNNYKKIWNCLFFVFFRKYEYKQRRFLLRGTSTTNFIIG